MELSDLFVALSVEDRLKVIFLLEKENLTLTSISRKMNLSLQESSRQLSRLKEEKLLKKNDTGHYYLTPYGRAVLCIILNQQFLVKNCDYFLKHTLSKMHSEHISRIGELNQSIRIKKIMNVIELIEASIQRASQEIILICDQILTRTISAIELKSHDGVDCTLFLADVIYSRFFEKLRSCKIKKLPLKDIQTFLLLTEREAIVSFPDVSGNLDYSEVFYAQDEKSRKWCYDLFIHYSKFRCLH